MKSKNKPCQLQPLTETLKTIYGNDLPSISYDLSRAIYLLQYLDFEDNATIEEIRDISFTLQQLNRSFYECHLKIKESESDKLV